MTQHTIILPQSPAAELAHRVEAFEAARGQDAAADLAAFLPAPGHPLRLAVLGELIRVDLDAGWAAGRPKRLADYLARFPALLENGTALAAVAFEEYRQRRRAGEAASPCDYEAVYGIDTTDWFDVEPAAAGPDWETPGPATQCLARTPGPVSAGGDESVVVRDFPLYGFGGAGSGSGRPASSVADTAAAALADWDPSDHDSVSRMIEARKALPEPGTEFLGFRLVEELGRGAFGRVYLAHQWNLAGRPVALKIACDIAGESQTLAQLQHTNIVPIYSFHTAGPFQAVCMPYFGRTTLAQVVKRLGDRPSMPHSGRELKSTLHLHAGSTLGSATAPSHPAPAFAPPFAESAPAAGPAPPTLPATTEAVSGWTTLEGLSYVEAVLWLGEQLASGLAHAHARGILHRDLKPANVLLTDEGRPMLLDFNLAEDVKLRGTAERAAVGGTLPYMAPEQIEAFGRGGNALDGRCDLYALGVILFELLTGHHPFPARTGSARQVLPVLLEDRRQAPPSARKGNPAVSPAADAIVRKCLAPNPADRYRTADDLREDIDRHLNNLPLKHAPNPSLSERAWKWARRHPKLASSGTVAALAAAVLVGAGAAAAYSWDHNRTLQARGRFADHQAAFADAQVFFDDRNQSWPRLDEGQAKLRAVLARYSVPEDGADDAWLAADPVRRLPDDTRNRVREDVGEAFYRLAHAAYLKAFTAPKDSAERTAQVEQGERWNVLAERYAADRLPRAVREQRAALADLRGDAAAGKRLREQADAAAPESARDAFLLGTKFAQKGESAEALVHLRQATRLDPQDFSAWFVRGTAHLALDQNDLAAMCFGSCVALRPDFAPAWLNRGMALARLRSFPQARDDYDRAAALDPKLTEAFIQRAVVKAATGDAKGAAEDYTRALDTGEAPVRVLFLRAAVRTRLGDKAGAKSDREAGLKTTPADELSWVARAEAKAGTDPAGALADVDAALKLNPLSLPGLQMKAHLLGERLHRSADALAVLDRAVEFYPDHAPTLAGRAVELARAGKRAEALRDARAALLRDARGLNLYQVGCVYALTSKADPDDRIEARRLLWAALKTGQGMEYVDADTDLDPLRADPEFKRLVADAKTLHAARNR